MADVALGIGRRLEGNTRRPVFRPVQAGHWNPAAGSSGLAGGSICEDVRWSKWVGWPWGRGVGLVGGVVASQSGGGGKWWHADAQGQCGMRLDQDGRSRYEMRWRFLRGGVGQLVGCRGEESRRPDRPEAPRRWLILVLVDGERAKKAGSDVPSFAAHAPGRPWAMTITSVMGSET